MALPLRKYSNSAATTRSGYSPTDATIARMGLLIVALLFTLLCCNLRAQTAGTESHSSFEASAANSSSAEVQPESLSGRNDIEAVANRPSASNPAHTTKIGVLEVEYGTELAISHKDLNTLTKFGLTKDLELRFANNPTIADSAAGISGVGDVEIGFKYRFLHQSKKLPALAFGYAINVPTATGSLGSEGIDHNFLALASKDFGKHHFDLNSGISLLGGSGGNGFDAVWVNALSWSHPLKGKWGIGGELSGNTHQNIQNPS